MDKFNWLITYLNLWRTLPCWVLFRRNKFNEKCLMDLEEWSKENENINKRALFWQFSYWMVHCKECRNIFHNRLHRDPVKFAIARILLPPRKDCFISMPPEKLGGGFHLCHGFATIVSASEIGERCSIYQQVTVGRHNEKNPYIGNDVKIFAGAIVFGDVHIGSGAVIGAGAIVNHDIPENAVAVSPAAKVVKVDGKRI